MKKISFKKLFRKKVEQKKTEENWRPKYDEEFWHIDRYVSITHSWWEGDQFDKQQWKFGNCFKTKKEANKALELVKEILINL